MPDAPTPLSSAPVPPSVPPSLPVPCGPVSPAPPGPSAQPSAGSPSAGPPPSVVLPPRHYSVLAGVLSYLIPGLGQVYQGRVSKGVFFMATLLGLFFAGQALGDWRNVYLPNAEGPNAVVHDPQPWKLPSIVRPFTNVFRHRWQYAGQFWIGIAAWPALWQYANLTVPSEETSKFLHNFQRGPHYQRPFDPMTIEENQREYIRNHDKTPDVAWVYTVIAGVLNILVIYDAFAGPAYGRVLSEKKQPPPGAGEVALP
jgi:hypothetical protein